MKKIITGFLLVVVFDICNAQNSAVLRIDSAKQIKSKHIYKPAPFTSFSTNGTKLLLKLPPFSVVVLELK